MLKRSNNALREDEDRMQKRRKTDDICQQTMDWLSNQCPEVLTCVVVAYLEPPQFELLASWLLASWSIHQDPGPYRPAIITQGRVAWCEEGFVRWRDLNGQVIDDDSEVETEYELGAKYPVLCCTWLAKHLPFSLNRVIHLIYECKNQCILRIKNASLKTLREKRLRECMGPLFACDVRSSQVYIKLKRDSPRVDVYHIDTECYITHIRHFDLCDSFANMTQFYILEDYLLVCRKSKGIMVCSALDGSLQTELESGPNILSCTIDPETNTLCVQYRVNIHLMRILSK